MSAIVRAAAGACLVVLSAACRSAPAATADPEYASVAAALEPFIEHEMADKELPSLAIALVDDQQIVWARGFGNADTTTIWRVGSISKLFTDIALMQLVERGQAELDVPITRYLPDFDPSNPFGGDLTLRQLMSHRSGLVREPPVGHYFDPTEPTLAATAQSLNATALVYPPGTRTKYSNAAIAVAGYLLEALQGEPFAAQVKRSVLDPIGLESSAFEWSPEVEERLADAFMWTADGRTFEAPTFQLGMAPAGSMYSTVTDLGRFLSVLFAGGSTGEAALLSPESLEEMWTPQFADSGATAGFGLGFSVSRLDGERRIGHGGAIYGFASELAALPDRKLGVVVLTNVDLSNTVVERIANAALRLMVATKEGRPLPALPVTAPVPDTLARRLAGSYVAGERRIDLLQRPGAFYLTPAGGYIRARLRLRGDTLVVDDRLTHGTTIVPLDSGRIRVGADTFTRAPRARPAPAPGRWEGLIGEYGWDHNTLYILERGGQLHALIEWFFLDPLEQVAPDRFRFPDRGLYAGETLTFVRDASGRATGASLAGVVFPRRQVGTEAGVTFRITPVRPVEELRAAALAATPPTEEGDFLESDLVEVAKLDPSIRLDVRYATTDNFMGSVFYPQARAFLQRPAAEAVVRAHRKLREQGFGLLIHDGYRPWYVTKMFWDATPEAMREFVADPARGSRHNRGAAVDLTLYDLATGEPIRMVGGYDEFSARSYPDYPGGTALQRWHRDLLREVMEAEGFQVYEVEWWHFDYGEWRRYPIGTAPFDRLAP